MFRFVSLTRAVWSGALLLFLTGASASAAPPTHPVIPGFERFHTGEKANAAHGGRLLLGELNCASCHESADPTLNTKKAPVLDNVAQRVRVSYLKKFLRDPQAVKAGTSMPNLLADDPDAGAKVEALVQFLATTGALRQERPNLKGIGTGRDLYHKVGCVACHGTRDAKGAEAKLLSTSVPLGDLKAKYSIASLGIFLESPHTSRPSGRMPRILNGKEAREVANYLLQGAKVNMPGGKGATNYAYYEGSWTNLPNFARLKPRATGKAVGIDLSVARRGNNYALKFEGVLKVEHEAVFTFSSTSDDGSRIAVDGKTVVNNDGTHPPQTVSGSIKLSKGVHKVVLTFFQAGGGAELAATVEAPGFGHQSLGDVLAPSEADLVARPPAPKAKNDDDALVIDPQLVEKGKGLFATLGCANCHQLRSGPGPIASKLKAVKMGELKGEGGCLSAAPTKGAPWFSLAANQRKALAAAVKVPPLARTPQAVIAHTLTTFNCYACHSRNKIGGPQAELDKSFTTTQPEMGDEGRVPPPLDGVGAKLKLAYLKQILDKGAHDRPYMHTHMPGFGLANVADFVEAVTALDKLPAVPEVKFTGPLSRTKGIGRHLVGPQAFGCIKCHTFAGHKAEGVQGIDMTLMTTRLQRDWFQAYVADPQRIRPGTRMPTGFIDGKSTLPEFFDGTAPTQIEAMWLYLQDGKKARLPAGLQRNSIPLEPKTSAIVYRNFIEGAGPRAIGVGYPESANLAFDANEMRLALIWHGAFIDAARHWTNRGEGYEGPAGDNVLRLHNGASFAVLPKADDAWPTVAPKILGYRFRGYRLTPDDRPTFLYSLGEVRFEDFFAPIVAGSDVSLRRTLAVTAPAGTDNLYFRAAVGNKIEELAGGWYRVDGGLKVKVAGGRIRKSAGKAELLVPVRFADGKAQLTVEYAW